MSIDAVHIDNLSVYYGQTPAISGVCLDMKGLWISYVTNIASGASIVILEEN